MYSSFTARIVISTSLLITVCSSIQSVQAVAVEMHKDHCLIPGLYGPLPKHIGLSIQQFSRGNSDIQSMSVLTQGNINRMLLHGPSGNGKTAIAQKFAQLTKSKFVSIDAPDIVTKYQNEGAMQVNKMLMDIDKHLEDTTGPITFFIDEIDALGVSRSEGNNNHLDTERAMQKLWLGLSKYERDPQIFFIFATNNVKSLPPPFLKRFTSERVIKIDNPSPEQRKVLLTNFLMHGNIPSLNRRIFNKYFKLINQPTNSELYKDYKNYITSLHESLHLIDEQMILKDKRNSTRINELTKQILDILSRMKKTVTTANQTNLKPLAAHKDLTSALDEYGTLISGYIKCVENAATPVTLAPDLLHHVAEKTDGISNRGLQMIATAISDIKIPITIDMLDTLIKATQEKLKLEEEENKRKNREERTKDLQLEELEVKKKQQELDLRIKELQKEELEEKKKQLEKDRRIKDLQLNELESKKQLLALEKRSAVLKLAAEIRVSKNAHWPENVPLSEIVKQAFKKNSPQFFADYQASWSDFWVSSIEELYVRMRELSTSPIQ